MKAPDFEYECPSTLADALAYLSGTERECQPLAGGQSLMPMMNLRLANPDVLIDLNQIEELDFIREDKTQIRIGAMVRYSTLMESPIVQKHIPLFTLALPHIAHDAIRHRGTIGGSVALADPAAEMPALLRALNADIIVVSSAGTREIAADDFFLGLYETALLPGELIHSINVRVAEADQSFGFYELARRHGDYAMAGVAISARSISPYDNLRIVFFSIADYALRASKTEAVLQGEHYSQTTLNKARMSLSELEFNEDMNADEPVKAHLCAVVLQRALDSMNKETP